MAHTISKDIISKVKNELGISDPTINVTDIYKKLCYALVRSHPDLFTDGLAKEKAEVRFMELNSLRDDLKAYMEQQSAEGQLVLYDDNAEITTLQNIIRTADQEVEISKLKDEIRLLSDELNLAKERLKRNLRIISDMKNKNVVASCANLADIYKPKKLGNVIGVGAAVFSLSVLIPQVQMLIDKLGMCGIVGSVLIWLITIVWLLSWIWNIISNGYVRSLIDKFIVGKDLLYSLNVMRPKNGYTKAYFTEQSLLELIEKRMDRRSIHILFWGRYNSIQRQVLEHIILELEHKQIIVGSSTNDMQRLFYIEHKGGYDDVPF